MGSPRQEYWSGLLFPAPGDLLNPEIKLSLLHCRQILYCLSYQGSPVPSLINHKSTFFFLEEEEIREVGREKSRSCLLSNVDREYFLCF